jgi:zinc protease
MLNWRITHIALTFVVLSSAFTAHAARQYDFEQSTLDNGLRVVTLEDFSCPIISVHVWYDVGSKDENPHRQGFAHMFEHMMFRGTDLLDSEDHFKLVRRTGGSNNAFTNFDYTAYVNSLPANQLELGLWLEAERMMFLNVDQEGFETERKIVEEERRQDLNSPYGTTVEQVMPHIFKEHPYRWTPIGKIPHLRAADISELQVFWDKFYTPDNATLVIVGAVKHEEAQKQAEKYFGWMPRGPERDKTPNVEPPQTAPREVTLDERLGPLPLTGYIYRGISRTNPDFYPLEILMMVLGNGESSRLYIDLVKEQKVCPQIMADTWALKEDGVFGAGAALLPGSDVDAVLAALDSHLQRVIDEPITENELTKAKNNLLRSTITGTLTVSNKTRSIGRTSIIHGDPDYLNQQLDAIKNVTIEDVQRVARAYITPERRTTLRVMPNPNKPEKGPADDPTITAIAAPDGPRVKAGVKRPDDYPMEPPLKPLLEELPEARIHERVLKNGLKVVVVPNSEVPFTTAMLGLKYGAWAEEPAAPGVASMALDMLTKGTENYTANELAEIIDFNALSLGGGAGMDVASVSATAVSDKLPLALELLGEVVLRPTFPESEFALLRDQLKTGMTVQEQDPSYLADRELRRQLYGNHPYARSASGELADLEDLNIDRLKAWWKKYARPDAAVLYIAGDVKARKAFRMAKEVLGDWEADGPLPDTKLPELSTPQTTQIYLVDVPGAVQSQIRVGQRSITRGHPYYHASRVFTQVYGGAFASRLNQAIRINAGLTYGASGGFMPARFDGRFASYTFTRTETTAEAVQLLLDVVDEMGTKAATGEEMTSAQSYLVGSFPRQLEVPQDAVAYQWVIEQNGLPKDYLAQALRSYKETTVDDVSHVANNIIDTETLVITVAGDAAKVKESLEAIAPVTVVASAPQGE